MQSLYRFDASARCFTPYLVVLPLLFTIRDGAERCSRFCWCHSVQSRYVRFTCGCVVPHPHLLGCTAIWCHVHCGSVSSWWCGPSRVHPLPHLFVVFFAECDPGDWFPHWFLPSPPAPGYFLGAGGAGAPLSKPPASFVCTACWRTKNLQIVQNRQRFD